MIPVTTGLPYSPPYDWPAALAFLGARSIAGVEHVTAGAYRRTVRCGNRTGTIEVCHHDTSAALLVTVRGLPRAEADASTARVRWMFDLDADLPAITAHLSRDPWLAPLVSAGPAIRVFRGWDPFEVAIRSVIGQQITVSRARHLNGILADRCGERLNGRAGEPLRRLFPSAQQIIDADLSAIGMPGARVTTLKTLAAAVLAEPDLFERRNSVDGTVGRLRAIRGVGDWTAHYIAMRACGEPDAFPASDVGLLRGAAARTGRRPTPAELLARAERWRPWRAYAAHHLWAIDAPQKR